MGFLDRVKQLVGREHADRGEPIRTEPPPEPPPDARTPPHGDRLSEEAVDPPPQERTPPHGDPLSDEAVKPPREDG